MKVDKKQKRLKAIKLRYALFSTKCECSGEEYKHEKMWKVNRWGINNSIRTWHFCQNCMHSAEEVLNEIDTDASIFGIAFVDSINFIKKNYTKIEALFKN